ncbi:hypothetical protein TELCIR_18915, partial [Teladorsagia circumcincta]
MCVIPGVRKTEQTAPVTLATTGRVESAMQINRDKETGYGIGAVNAMTDGNLLEKLRISRLPAIVAIVEGRVTHYRADIALSIMNPHIHELRAESYFGMIRLLKPGCRSLILLVDEQNKEKLLMQFAQYILPLRSNKTFSFGFLMVEKNLPWFQKLLEHTLPLGEENAPKDGNSLYVKLKSINPRQTVGTVLALCGWKLYFSIYHPMHTAGKKKQPNHHFLGFDDDEDITSDSDSDNGTAEDISVVVLGAAPEPRMRYLLAAMKYSHFARFAYIHLASPSDEVASIRDDLSIKCTQCENVLIFNDLPGLSSSEYLDELCPVSSRNPRRLCVILPVMDSSEDEGFLNSFRMFARQHKDLYAQQKVVLTYIYANRQSEWIKPFLEKRAGDSVVDARDVLVIWRIEHVKARFTWLESAWGVGAEHFETLLGSVISQVTRLDLTAPVGNL